MEKLAAITFTLSIIMYAPFIILANKNLNEGTRI